MRKRGALIGLYPKGWFYQPPKKQKPQIDFLRFLCYNKNNNFKEEKGDAYERRD